MITHVLLIYRAIFKAALLIALLASCAVSNAWAETNITFHLDALASSLPAHFDARVIFTGSDALKLREPQHAPDPYFDVELIAKDMAKASSSSRTVDQIIFSYRFSSKGDLSPGKYKLPSAKVVSPSGAQNIVWPTVQVLAPNAKAPPPPPYRLRQTTSTRRAFVGEQVVYVVEAQSPNGSKNNDLNIIELPGVWQEAFGDPKLTPHNIGKLVVLRGERRKALFATRAGTLRIPARALSLEMPSPPVPPRPKRDTFAISAVDDAFNQRRLLDQARQQAQALRPRKHRLSAAGFTIDIRPLPPAPPEMEGYIPVGEFTLTSGIDKHSITLGESVSLRATIEGDGNLRPLSVVLVEQDPAFKYYISSPALEQTERNGRLIHKKSFEIVLVAQQAGELETPPFGVPTFDPRSEKYRFLSAPSYRLSVASPATSTSQAANVEGPRSLAPGGLRAQHELDASGRDELSTLVLQATLLFGPLIVVLTLFLPSLREALGDEKLRRRRQAFKRFEEEIASAEREPDALVDLFSAYVRDRLSLEQTLALTPQEACLLLAERLREKETVEPLRQFFSELERARFGAVPTAEAQSVAVDSAALRALLQRVESGLSQTRL